MRHEIAAILMYMLMVRTGSVAIGGVRTDDAGDLRVMTFNIRYDNPRDGPDAWPKRKEILYRTIEAFDPDLLGLQEVTPSQGAQVRERFAAYEFIGVPRENGKTRGEMAAVLYRRDRFEKVRDGTFWLSGTPDVVGSKGWDAALARVVTWVELRDHRHGEARLFFFNTHWDHKGETARQESAKLMRRKMVELAGDAAVVVAGDFNTGADSPPHEQMIGSSDPAKLADTFIETHAGATTRTSSFHGFTGKDSSDQRIDWILRSRAFTTREAAIDRYHEGERFPSDHFAVTAILRWRTGDAASSPRVQP